MRWTCSTKAETRNTYIEYRILAKVTFPAEADIFSLRHCIQTGSGAHPTSYTVGTGDYFPGKEVARA
jgi:hypothetical protein